MPINPTLNVRSIVDLIASDLAYKGGIQPGEFLRSFPDNKPTDGKGSGLES